MLQSLPIQQLLVQLLEPIPQLTPSIPLSASLISLKLRKPLLSCISKTALDHNDNFITNSNDFSASKTLDHGNNTYFVNETSPLLRDNSTDALINRSKTPTYLGETGRNNSGNSNNVIASAKSRIDELQKEIDNLEENYDSDYINANINPIDNLNILSLLVIRDWKNKTDAENWKVYSFYKYRLYMHYVNDEFTLLFCTIEDFPSSVAIAKLEAVSNILRSKL
ncbi:hypothetical protein CANINC_004665 [Pichia inconspicua]|uniref:Uncharacterized protein n=1 Tax=Pichia inconspicua TaxID=52247 RepID=A0A4T0WW48_9ASCO|nr:hypothetical protein CANINC_004665 [[Candida] inconspicua]